MSSMLVPRQGIKGMNVGELSFGEYLFFCLCCCALPKVGRAPKYEYDNTRAEALKFAFL